MNLKRFWNLVWPWSLSFTQIQAKNYQQEISYQGYTEFTISKNLNCYRHSNLDKNIYNCLSQAAFQQPHFQKCICDQRFVPLTAPTNMQLLEQQGEITFQLGKEDPDCFTFGKIDRQVATCFMVHNPVRCSYAADHECLQILDCKCMMLSFTTKMVEIKLEKLELGPSALIETQPRQILAPRRAPPEIQVEKLFNRPQKAVVQPQLRSQPQLSPKPSVENVGLRDMKPNMCQSAKKKPCMMIKKCHFARHWNIVDNCEKSCIDVVRAFEDANSACHNKIYWRGGKSTGELCFKTSGRNSKKSLKSSNLKYKTKRYRKKNGKSISDGKMKKKSFRKRPRRRQNRLKCLIFLDML